MNKKVIIAIAALLALGLVLNGIFDIKHILFPMFNNPDEVLVVLEGVWGLAEEVEKNDGIPTDELSFQGSNVKQYLGYGDTKATVSEYEVNIDDYKKGIFSIDYRNGDVARGTISNSSLIKMERENGFKWYQKKEKSALADIAKPPRKVTDEEVEASIRTTQKEIDRLQGEIDRLNGGTMNSSDEVLYWSIAEDEVKKHLKSPSSAKFPFSTNSDGVNITKLGDIVTVSAYVDAQNSFGVEVRSDFVVKIKISGTRYSIESCIID